MFPEILVQTWPVLAMRVRLYAVGGNLVKLLIQQDEEQQKQHQHQ